MADNPQNTAQLLNVIFNLPPVEVATDETAKSLWQFSFTDCKPGMSISQIKRELDDPNNECLLGWCCLNPPTTPNSTIPIALSCVRSRIPARTHEKIYKKHCDRHCTA